MFFLAARQFVNICRKKELEIKALITGGTGTVNPSGAPHSPPVFSGVLVAQSFLLCVVFYRSLFVLFLLAIVFVYPSSIDCKGPSGSMS
jgi:hypothetical protein